MSAHLSDEQMVGLLHGALSGDEHAALKRHLGGCQRCADGLAREAALEEILWQARPAAPAAPPRVVRRRVPVGVLLGAAVGIAATIGLGYAGLAGSASGAGREGMGDPLAWQNLIFNIALAAGVLLVLGSALGGQGHDTGHDAGHDAGHDHDGSHEHGSLGRALSVLGVGRVPLTVALMIACFLFGGLGVILNTLFASLGMAPGVYGLISVGAAFVGMVLLTGQAARLVGRILPSSETYPITRQDFAGCTGTLLLPADPTTGYAQVKDAEGNVHNVQCRTVRGALAKGTAILIVEYDEASKTYLVDANPVATRPA